MDPGLHLIAPARATNFEAALRGRTWRPYDLFSSFFLPSYTKAAERFARAQASVDLARVACALERYRLANGQYPETLDTLAPNFIPKLPPDVITGLPLRYQHTPDGQFVLYSVGWNATDDGGKVVYAKSGSPDMNQGDWVWCYSAR